MPVFISGFVRADAIVISMGKLYYVSRAAETGALTVYLVLSAGSVMKGEVPVIVVSTGLKRKILLAFAILHSALLLICLLFI